MISLKEIIITILGAIFSILIAFLLPQIINLDQISFIYVLLVIITLMILGIAGVLHKKIKENQERIDKQEVEQEKLGEKLKIHEQLIDMKADIKEIQKKVFKK